MRLVKDSAKFLRESRLVRGKKFISKVFCSSLAEVRKAKRDREREGGEMKERRRDVNGDRDSERERKSARLHNSVLNSLTGYCPPPCFS